MKNEPHSRLRGWIEIEMSVIVSGLLVNLGGMGDDGLQTGLLGAEG
jgi:hypothetical protein